MFFFFNDTATTEIYTLSLHDALPISLAATTPRRPPRRRTPSPAPKPPPRTPDQEPRALALQDRKSTRLNSSHDQISYAVFCLKKKRKPASPRDGRTTRPSRDSHMTPP